MNTNVNPSGSGTTPIDQSVREATFGVLRHHEMKTIFANPGSTEIAFLTGLPDDFDFRLALHEGSVVGMATGWAMAIGRPALVNLHTTAGLANAAGALATARTNRVPLVVVVGQQDRRHLANNPFLAGHLDGLLGKYPVSTDQPVRAQDVPTAVARAHNQALGGAGPALVVVPSDDWDQPAAPERRAAPLEMHCGLPSFDTELAELVSIVDNAEKPAIVAGSSTDDERSWASLVALAEKLGAPVWQEPFGARAGFPQDHPAFAGHLPAGRSGVRAALTGHDLLLVVGAPVLRQYPWEPGELVPDELRIVQLTQYADEAYHSVADLTIVTHPARLCQELARSVGHRGRLALSLPMPAPVPPPPSGEPLRPAHIFDLLAELLPADAVLVEESPSSRPELHRRVPARAPLGFVSAAAGGLGFGLPAAIGLRMGAPHRPVVAVLGDGSSMYGIQALWSAAHYQVGVVFIVLSNGRYAIMDRLAEQSGRGKPPWPAFTELQISDIARGLGCPAQHVQSHEVLSETLSEVLPNLTNRSQPLVIDVDVAPDPSYG